MAEPPTDADARDDPDRHGAPRTPRWVKVSGVLALITVALIVVMLLAGGAQHGPARHAPGGGDQQPQRQQGGQAPGAMQQGQTPSGADAGGHTPPPGGQR